MCNFPSPTGSTTPDAVSQLVLRTLLHFPVVTMIESKPLWDAPALKNLVLRHCGITATIYARSRGTSLVARCRHRLEEVTKRLEILPIAPRDVLAIELASALQMSIVEHALLRLAIYVVDHPDVGLAMNLMGCLDNRGSAAVISATLGADSQTVYQALVVDSAMRRVDFVECLTDRYPSEFLDFPNPLAHLVTRQDVTAKELLALLSDHYSQK